MSNKLRRESTMLPSTLNAKNQQCATKLRSRPHDPVIRGYDEAGDVIETQEHAGDFKEW